MSLSVFGIEHPDVSKGLMGMARALRPGKAAIKGADGLKVAFKPITPGVKPTGPGSLRGVMDPTAWATRTAAKKP